MSDTTNEIEGPLLGCIGACALVPVLFAYPVLLGGYALQLLWGWFVVPVFHLPALSLAAACGLDVLVSMMRGASENRDKTEKEKARSTYVNIGYRFIYLTAFYATAVAIGYVIRAVWL